jgi:hypothetical protein
MKYKTKIYKRNFFFCKHQIKSRYVVYRYRFDPVPGIHNYKNYNLFRKPATTQEKKYACDPEHKPYIRGKRRLSYLPEAWDDIFISNNLNKRSWKKIKKRKQWM